MSDLYLVLRSRLEGVPEWVYIPTPTLRSAREAKGLSYETMARTIPVSAKTWERYEKAGRIPRPIVPRVAEMLDLEIEESAPRPRVIVPHEREAGGGSELLDAVEAIVNDATERLSREIRAVDAKVEMVGGGDAGTRAVLAAVELVRRLRLGEQVQPRLVERAAAALESALREYEGLAGDLREAAAIARTGS